MSKSLKRRDAIKMAAAAGGLLALGNSAPAATTRPKISNFAGSWAFNGEPCAIFQQGEILLLVNEKGDLGTALATGPNAIVLLQGEGWDVGLTGELDKKGTELRWSNDSAWKKT